MKTYHIARINGEITSFKMEEGISMTGWNVEAICNDGFCRTFFIEEISENKAFGIVRRKFQAEHKERQTFNRAGLLFSRMINLSPENENSLFCFIFGLMKSRMEKFDLDSIEKEIEQCELEKEKQKEVPFFEHKITIIPDEEVDVSDCCHSKDLIPVAPLLRHSLQGSPDDSYCVCGSCKQKCDIETWKKSELEDERSYESGE